ncbi:MAG: UDP-N-acetylglucosamine 2-epimerase (non-hydrolyzing), partial [Clostridia bacterium]|nr:UDP-N-acetylglucosamine 2-epimerase (non-hydrolyzing) [Clostridia bacterium]
DLDIMRQEQTLTEITVRALQGLGEILRRERPDLVLVHGDTTTTFAGSLASFYQQIPVGHVEAGLRTDNKYAPFPEEINRRLTGVLADWHFAPTRTAKESLLREGVASSRIFVTGNTVIDALYATLRRECDLTRYHQLDRVDFSRRILLVTSHRRENLGEPMREIFLALREIVNNYPQVEIVFPVHKNPLVRSAAEEILGGMARVHLIEPLDYQPFIHLMAKSYLVLTDSGGLQEEAPALGKPVLVLRETTERPEAVEAGTVLLAGTSGKEVYEKTAALLDDEDRYRQMAEAVNPYGDGQASRRIAQAILYVFGLSKEPPDEYEYDPTGTGRPGPR